MANINITYSYPEELMPYVIGALCDYGGYRSEALDGAQANFAKQQVINIVRRITEQYIKKNKIEEGVQSANNDINNIIIPGLENTSCT